MVAYVEGVRDRVMNRLLRAIKVARHIKVAPTSSLPSQLDVHNSTTPCYCTLRI